ncbi:MAG: RNA pseudouridine synthase [Alistipes sp.]|nr:RNA pseudouridine synthase [Alistipes sp.]
MEHIIFENKDYIVYNKPAGMLVQSDKSFDVDLVSRLMTYLSQKGEKPRIFVINRLDRPVSGLVLLAKNKETASKLSKDLAEGRIGKEYMAVVHGGLAEKTGTFTDYLLKDGRSNLSKVVSGKEKDAKKAVLEYEVLETKQELSLVRIRLVTGRHHQIRVQFASRGHALYGDTKYGLGGERSGERGMIALCSCELSFWGRTFTVEPEGGAFEYFRKDSGTL